VIGAGRGIGRDVAVELAEMGVRLGLVARSEGQLAATAAQVRGLGARAVVLPADLEDPSQVEDLLLRVANELGGVDILVNNAGVVRPLGPTLELRVKQWTRAVELILISPVRLTVGLAPGMLARGWGRIVNVSSGVVTAPASMVGGNAYVTAKSALEAHTVNLAAELAATGVTVNAYRPGAVATQMQEWIRDQEPARVGGGLVERFRSRYEAGALISPETSARALVSHLASDETGQIWDVSDPV
jgi:3-oxoacyl-[acyl-carrier protein] reductase